MKVSDIATLVQGIPAGDLDREIHGVAALETAGPNELAYVESAKALEPAAASRAGCLLIPQAASLPGLTTIAVRYPKLALVRAAEALHPAPVAPPGIHPTAVVAADAQLAPDCSIGPNVVIEGGAAVGAGTRLSAGVFLGAGVRVGAHSILHPRVTVYSGATIGNHVIIHAGVVVGSDGFGYVFAEGRQVKFPSSERSSLKTTWRLAAIPRWTAVRWAQR